MKTMKGQIEERGYWESKVEFILAVAGYVVGLGNVWRFPYLCYKYGGGAFLIPYLLFGATCGVPLFLLESAMGQYTQEGGITCWRRFCPLAEGIGYAGQVIQVYGCMYYIVILAWALFYLIFSFSSQLPWASCDNPWNTDNCVNLAAKNLTLNWTTRINSTPAATEFWERRVLALSGGIEEVGNINWEILLCLIVMWIVCYFCIWKGVRSTGKVWMEAASQIVFSYSLSVGTVTVLSSYNRYSNNCYRDCFWLCLLNSGTSLVAGFAVFSVLGFMAHQQGVPIDEVAESGPGLAFIAYPQAVAMMPFPQLWAVCFFIMIILLGIDTHFVAMESIITSVTDMFPNVLRRSGRRELFLLFFCLSCFVGQIFLVTEGGMYVFQLFDNYACSGACLLILCVFESLAMGWIFGAKKMFDAIEDMTSSRPNCLIMLCWKYLTPLGFLVAFIFSVMEYQPLTFNRWYVYPDWAYALGWLMALSSILLVPGWAMGRLLAGKGSLKQRWLQLCNPDTNLPLTNKQRAGKKETDLTTQGKELVRLTVEEHENGQ
ncbi:Sodium- and chloride-dependent GABA transporter 2 [Labeo rohita]|uniref:Transporter n=1 Tax=Labeo rohita TaxID=84645 RepID=A0ABQ8MVQ3_LABRO|nr:Sodium- and chloride-dependent GABA transporter 2 [Labeo rohita]